MAMRNMDRDRKFTPRHARRAKSPSPPKMPKNVTALVVAKIRLTEEGRRGDRAK